MNAKESKYSELVEEVRKCKKCMSGQKSQGIKIVQDKCRSQINLWSHWQGSLDANILVIGQDWWRNQIQSPAAIGLPIQSTHH